MLRAGGNMIFDIIRNGFTIDLLVQFMARIFVMFCVLPIHEFAHAFVANKLGDQTARLSGRLTLNPFSHLDLFGSLLILIAGFGYAKPVPVNPRNFKNPKGGMALTAVAGPLSNLIMGFLFCLCYCAVFKFANVQEGSFYYALAYFFMYSCTVNITLAVFNFIPIPPLDGSRLLQLFVPDRLLFKYARYERYLVYAVLVIVLLGWLDTPISVCSGAVWKVFLKAGAAIFGLDA